MYKFIHASDIHLDSPLRGLEYYEGAPKEKIRLATREALENLVDAAVKEKTAFVLISGDIYDGDWKDYNTGLFFIKQMSRLKTAQIQVFLVSGNHDASSQITHNLQLPDNVASLSAQKPQTHIIEPLKTAIHGQSYSRAAVSENLALNYPDALSGYFNIGVLHTNCGAQQGHDPYAPCSLDNLRSKRYDYWALGHIHKRSELDTNPWIVYCGCTQGRHINEEGQKGCTLVTVDNNQVKQVEHIALDVMRWFIITIDASGTLEPQEIIYKVNEAVKQKIEENENRVLAIRLIIKGSCKAHRELAADRNRWINEIRASVSTSSSGAVWIEKVYFHTSLEINIDDIIKRDDPIAGLLSYINALNLDMGELKDLTKEFEPIKNKLPDPLEELDNLLNLKDQQRTKQLLEDVRQILLTRLLTKIRTDENT
ncbi:metallophosphoesterase [Candidatus Magnetoovum chiemensis]|nr:metallophosphoesterase [Candidatus Magnetoovum chiemensis]